MLEVLKTVIIGFVAISVFLSFYTLSRKLTEELHFIFSIISMAAVVLFSYFIGGLFR